MKVYAIYEGCCFEGGGIHIDAYLEREKARLFASQIFLQNKKESEELGNGHRPWKQVNPDRWTDTYDEIQIIELTVH